MLILKLNIGKYSNHSHQSQSKSYKNDGIHEDDGKKGGKKFRKISGIAM